MFGSAASAASSKPVFRNYSIAFLKRLIEPMTERDFRRDSHLWNVITLMFRKNKNPEKIGARARNTPFGTWREAFGYVHVSEKQKLRVNRRRNQGTSPFSLGAKR
uniref:Uncharacterized protein n=1 Tax=Candidatus Kentrum sp. SD TaxID=2126332 RepID=A0A451BK52_9GAMM|nr:MAG: hypothetical protein BECKSD772F_GA0070984_10229 [Candidatus Kentron sp. SD]VFK42981.1 MAG: hypothetical protein BECKSD772E_GA0070983_10219 [Candidatus Kentron sp. SD]VFK78596.1 MAG: hypothetical protein BECKSD772D_GA0070982_10199 [Candidatus Kentron sp. SD]